MKKSETIKLLRQWIEVIANAPEEKFNMNFWGRTDHASARKLNKGQTVCATAACAAGWATVIPTLRKRGLRLQLTIEGSHFADVVFGDSTGGEAIKNAFGILHRQAVYITSARSQYPGEGGFGAITREYVIKRIERVIGEVERDWA